MKRPIFNQSSSTETAVGAIHHKRIEVRGMTIDCPVRLRKKGKTLERGLNGLPVPDRNEAGELIYVTPWGTIV